eukprot:scaffold52640_cov63-Phaeocystis_antarctica.AAC.1
MSPSSARPRARSPRSSAEAKARRSRNRDRTRDSRPASDSEPESTWCQTIAGTTLATSVW